MDEFAFRSVATLYRFMSKIPVTRRLAAKRFSALCQKNSPVPKVRAKSGDIPVTLDLSVGSDRTIYLQGACDLRGVRAIQRVMERVKPRTAWDVGANRGNHAAFMRPLCERLYCFEPNPAEARRVRELFRSDPGVTVLDIGLSDQSATRPFLIHPVESGNSTFEVTGDQANAAFQVTTGDELVSLNRLSDLDFIKVDVEGHERNVLRGMSAILVQQRPIIILEILEAQSTPAFGLDQILPDYAIYGNKTGVISGITMSAYQFCRFEYGKTYMSALAVPMEKRHLLKGMIPDSDV